MPLQRMCKYWLENSRSKVLAVGIGFQKVHNTVHSGHGGRGLSTEGRMLENFHVTSS